MSTSFATSVVDERTSAFTTMRPASITIIKDAQPNSDQDFSFSTDQAGIPGFLLDDDSNGTLSHQQVMSNLPAGTYTFYARALDNHGAPTTATVTDGPRSGAIVSASADANRNGGAPCESYAYASVTSNSLSPSSYSKSKLSETCPPAST